MEDGARSVYLRASSDDHPFCQALRNSLAKRAVCKVVQRRDLKLSNLEGLRSLQSVISAYDFGIFVVRNQIEGPSLLKDSTVDSLNLGLEAGIASLVLGPDRVILIADDAASTYASTPLRSFARIEIMQRSDQSIQAQVDSVVTQILDRMEQLGARDRHQPDNLDEVSADTGDKDGEQIAAGDASQAGEAAQAGLAGQAGQADNSTDSSTIRKLVPIFAVVTIAALSALILFSRAWEIFWPAEHSPDNLLPPRTAFLSELVWKVEPAARSTDVIAGSLGEDRSSENTFNQIFCRGATIEFRAELGSTYLAVTKVSGQLILNGRSVKGQDPVLAEILARSSSTSSWQRAGRIKLASAKAVEFDYKLPIGTREVRLAVQGDDCSQSVSWVNPKVN